MHQWICFLKQTNQPQTTQPTNNQTKTKPPKQKEKCNYVVAKLSGKRTQAAYSYGSSISLMLGTFAGQYQDGIFKHVTFYQPTTTQLQKI